MKCFRLVLLICIYVVLPFILTAQHYERYIYGGSSIGGPMPVKMADSAHANLKHGINAGVGYTFYYRSAFSISAEFSYQFVHLKYGQKLRKDTTVQVNIPMQNGNILTTNINTYYKADVNGLIKLNLFKLGTNFNYSKNKYDFTLGTYLSYFAGGFDKGDVYVTIGEGGVAGLDDYEEKYHNNKGMNKFTFELMARTQYNINRNFAFGFQLSRGLTPFYNKDFDIRGESMKFYNTIIGINLIYTFLKK